MERRTEPPPLLLLLHGFGSNEDDLFSLAPYLDRRFLIVSARAPLAARQGPDGSYAWFQIELLPEGPVADLDQARWSKSLLAKFIEELVEAYGINSERIYLMGFSQGAIMSLGLALTEPEKIAGVVAMSGSLPSSILAQVSAPESLRGLPIFIAHGIYDPMLPIHHSRACRESLKNLPVALTYREYQMGHEVTPESLRDISTWLSALLDVPRRTHTN